jgi:CHAD domain-containing protein
MAEAGRKVMLYHFAEMLRHEEATMLGEDIEALHDMRVATRRMRAAFEVFSEAFEPAILKPHLKGLRVTGRALGQVRDLDVFMEKAQHYLDAQPEADRSGLDPLLLAWGEQRENARTEMLTHLGGENYRIFKQEFNLFLQTPGVGARPISQDQPVPTIVRDVAPALIYTRLASVRAFDKILQTARIEQLHALRIEFKKLRYTVEFFREVLGEQSKAVIDDLKKLQDHLGDLNDAEVATLILREFLDNWDARQSERLLDERQNPEAIFAYLTARHAERYRLIVTFGELWVYFNRDEFRRNLALAVSVL